MINFKKLVKRNSGILSFLLIVVLCGVLLVNHSTSFCETLERGGHSFFSVFQLGLSGVQSVFSSSLQSIGELKRLREENAGLTVQLQEFLKIKSENEALKLELASLQDQLQLKDIVNSIYSSGVRQISARIIAKQPGNFFSTLIINKGRADGLRPKMAVVAIYDNYLGLVGKTLTVGEHTSSVMPLHNSSFFIAARFQSAYYEGLVNGSGENSRDLIMRYVQKQAKAEIQFGDLIISSGLSEIFPRGIHIGTVKAIRSKTYETSMEVDIEPVINLSRLEYVMVLDNNQSHE